MRQYITAKTNSLANKLESFTWIIRKEKNWRGQEGYLISLKGMGDVFSYGDSYHEAKRGLEESALLWMARNNSDFPSGTNQFHTIEIEAAMSNEDYERVNFSLKEWK